MTCAASTTLEILVPLPVVTFRSLHWAPTLALPLLVIAPAQAMAQEEVPMPDTLPPPVARQAPGVPDPLPEDAVELGSFGYEFLAGSLGVALGAGITYATATQQPDCNGGHVPVPCGRELMVLLHIAVTTPLLITGGVILGGNATGSNGRFFSTWGGTMIGALAGVLVTAPLTNENTSHEARLVSLPVIGLSAVGGGVLFYRNSASAPRMAVVPTLDGRGAMFNLQGAL